MLVLYRIGDFGRDRGEGRRRGSVSSISTEDGRGVVCCSGGGDGSFSTSADEE